MMGYGGGGEEEKEEEEEVGARDGEGNCIEDRRRREGTGERGPEGPYTEQKCAPSFRGIAILAPMMIYISLPYSVLFISSLISASCAILNFTHACIKLQQSGVCLRVARCL